MSRQGEKESERGREVDRLKVLPLSLSPFCVTQKKTARKK